MAKKKRATKRKRRYRKRKFTPEQMCFHCRNSGPMEIVAEYSRVEDQYDEGSQISWQEGDVYQLLICPACYGVILLKRFYHDGREPEIGFVGEPTVLYPLPNA